MIRAQCDPDLAACVRQRWALYYAAGEDRLLDRPAHVRAGSGLTRLGNRLALIQDDANFVAIIDPLTMAIESVVLPAHQGCVRQFDELRGNRLNKLDLEACTTVVEHDQQLLIALGSGSSPLRERIVVMKWPAAGDDDLCVYHARAFYEGLRSCHEFAGSELNIEGAVFLGDDTIRLFQRGNGAPRENRLPIDATCDISWRALRSHLAGAGPIATATNCQCYDLGELDGVRLTFTDGSVRNGSVFFTATAEASPDAIADGPVMGSVLGLIDEDRVRWALIHDEHGERLAAKVEGLCLDPLDPTRAWISIDRDEPTAPSELCEVELAGDWLPSKPAA